MKRTLAILIVIAFVLSTLPAFAARTSAPSATKPSMQQRVIGFWQGVFDWFAQMGPAGASTTKSTTKTTTKKAASAKK